MLKYSLISSINKLKNTIIVEELIERLSIPPKSGQ
jgi:hypothetical protein